MNFMWRILNKFYIEKISIKNIMIRPDLHGKNIGYTVYKRNRNLLINLYVLRHTHLFPYTSFFLLILSVGNTYKPYNSMFNIHRRPGQPQRLFRILRWFRIWFQNFSTINIPDSRLLFRFFSYFFKGEDIRTRAYE